MKLCEYGCGREAKYQFKNRKWCCENHYTKCINSKKIFSIINKGKTPWNKEKINIYSDELIKKKSEFMKGNQIWKGRKHTLETKQKIRESNKGRKHTLETKQKIRESNKGRKHTLETKQKISKKGKGRIPWNKGKSNIFSIKTRKQIGDSSKLTIELISKKYPTFFKIEEMRYNPNKPEEKEIQVHCKNHKCKNSKEHKGWFTPDKWTLQNRMYSVENGNNNLNMYCSDECKDECPLYNKRVSQLIKEDQIKAGVIKEEYYTSDEKQTFNEEVFKRADDLCEYCGQKAEHVHHSRPQKIEPFFSLDPDYGISCCKECHYKYGHKTSTECSTGNLAYKVCI